MKKPFLMDKQALAILSLSSAFFGVYAAFKSRLPEVIDMSNDMSLGQHFREVSLSAKTGITYHHTGGNLDDTPLTISNINRSRLGSPRISYHVAAYDDGRIILLNPLGAVSWHVLNQNTPNIGIVMPGNFENSRPSKRHIETAIAAGRWVKSQKGLVNLKYLRGHNQQRATACPGKFVDLDLLRKKVGLSDYYA